MRSKFSLREAVHGLSESNDPRDLQWHLSRSLAWAFLDQKRGKQRRGARNAKHVGRVILSEWMHENWSEIQKGQVNDDLRRLMNTYRKFGGIKGGVKTPTPRNLLKRFKKVKTETQFVSEIVKYLCRVDADKSMDSKKFTINFAKLYAKKIQTDFIGKETYGDSKISKIWEKYAPSAPLIYAAYQITPDLGSVAKVEQISNCLIDISNHPSQVHRLIGYASYAADILAKTSVRKVFVRSFKGAERLKPSLPPFSEKEKDSIAEIDPKGPIE